jgi:hypothetical protein
VATTALPRPSGAPRSSAGWSEQDIVARGEPVDAIDIDRVAVRAAADVGAAIDEIRSLRAPQGASERVRPVLLQLGGIERRLEQLTAAGEDGDLARLTDAAEQLRLNGELLHDRASAAGLRECGRTEVTVAVSNALLAPVFATVAAEWNEWFQRALGRFTRRLPATRKEAADYYGRLHEFMGRARKRWLVLRPPPRAGDAKSDYESVLSDVQNLSAEISIDLDQGRRITPSWARAVQRKYRRLGRRERTAMRRVMRETGARPVQVPEPKRKPSRPGSEQTA